MSLHIETQTQNPEQNAAQSDFIGLEPPGTEVLRPEVVETKAIDTEAEYRTAMSTVGKRSRPPWVLRLLMNALEGYRQARKMGWSRPQNKYGVTTFASFELDVVKDRALIDAAAALLQTRFATLHAEQRQFVNELMTDPELRGFVFFQDITDGERRFEAATISLGRVTQGATRHRDRVDLIVEREVIARLGMPNGRIRAFVDPFHPVASGAPVALGAVDFDGESRSLLATLAAFYAQYRSVPEKQWQHWTQDYIDYFGPRTEPIRGTLFPSHPLELSSGRRLRSAFPPPFNRTGYVT